MNLFFLIRKYQEGMNLLGRTRFHHLRDEFLELLDDKSLEEVWDVFHALLRLTRIPYLGILAWPTAKKHAKRFIKTGSARSLRNQEKGIR